MASSAVLRKRSHPGSVVGFHGNSTLKRCDLPALRLTTVRQRATCLCRCSPKENHFENSVLSTRGTNFSLQATRSVRRRLCTSGRRPARHVLEMVSEALGSLVSVWAAKPPWPGFKAWDDSSPSGKPGFARAGFQVPAPVEAL